MDGAPWRGEGDGWKHPSAQALASFLGARPQSRGREETAHEEWRPGGASARAARGGKRGPRRDGGKAAAGVGPKPQARGGSAAPGKQVRGKAWGGYTSEGTASRAPRAQGRRGGGEGKLGGQASDGEGVAPGTGTAWRARGASPASPAPAAAPRNLSFQQPAGPHRQRGAGEATQLGDADMTRGDADRTMRSHPEALPASSGQAAAGAGSASRELWSVRARPGSASRALGVVSEKGRSRKEGRSGGFANTGPEGGTAPSSARPEGGTAPSSARPEGGTAPSSARPEGGTAPSSARPEVAQVGGGRQAQAEMGGSKDPIAQAKNRRRKTGRVIPAGSASRPPRASGPETPGAQATSARGSGTSGAKPTSRLASKPVLEATQGRGSASSAMHLLAQRLSTLVSRTGVSPSARGGSGRQSSRRSVTAEKKGGRLPGREGHGLFACIATVEEKGDVGVAGAAGALGRSSSRALSHGSGSSRRNAQAQAAQAPAASASASWRGMKGRDMNGSLGAARLGMSQARSMEFPRQRPLPRRSNSATASPPRTGEMAGPVGSCEGESCQEKGSVEGSGDDDRACDGRTSWERLEDERDPEGPARSAEPLGLGGGSEGQWGEAREEEDGGSCGESEGQWGGAREEVDGASSGESEGQWGGEREAEDGTPCGESEEWRGASEKETAGSGGASEGQWGGARVEEAGGSRGASEGCLGEASFRPAGHNLVVPMQMQDTVLWDFTKKEKDSSMGVLDSSAALCALAPALPLPLRQPAGEQSESWAGEEREEEAEGYRRGCHGSDNAVDRGNELDAETNGWVYPPYGWASGMSSEVDSCFAFSQGWLQQERKHQHQHQQTQHQNQHQDQHQDQHQYQPLYLAPSPPLVVATAPPSALSLRSSWRESVARGTEQARASPGGRSTGSGDAAVVHSSPGARSVRDEWGVSPEAVSEGGAKLQGFSLEETVADLQRGLCPAPSPGEEAARESEPALAWHADAATAHDSIWKIALCPSAVSSASGSAQASWEAEGAGSACASAQARAGWRGASRAVMGQGKGAPVRAVSPQLPPGAPLARGGAADGTGDSSSSTTADSLGYSDAEGAAQGGRRALSFSRPPWGVATGEALAQDRDGKRDGNPGRCGDGDRDRDGGRNREGGRGRELLGADGPTPRPLAPWPGLPDSRSAPSLRSRGRHRRTQSGEGVLRGRPPPAIMGVKDFPARSPPTKGRHRRSASISTVPHILSESSPGEGTSGAGTAAGEGANRRPLLPSRPSDASFSEARSATKESAGASWVREADEDADSDGPPALLPSRSLARLDIGKGLRWGKSWLRRTGKLATSDADQGADDETGEGTRASGGSDAKGTSDESAGAAGAEAEARAHEGGAETLFLGRAFALALQQQLQTDVAGEVCGPRPATDLLPLAPFELPAQDAQADILASFEPPSTRRQGGQPCELRTSGGLQWAVPAGMASDSPPPGARRRAGVGARLGSREGPCLGPGEDGRGGSGSGGMSRKASLADSGEVLISLWVEEGGSSPGVSGEEGGKGAPGSGPGGPPGSGPKKSGSQGRGEGEGEGEGERRSRILAGLKQRWMDTTGGGQGDPHPTPSRPPRPQAGATRVVRAKALRRAQLEAVVAREGHKRRLSFSEASSKGLPLPLGATGPRKGLRGMLERGAGRDSRGVRKGDPPGGRGEGGAGGEGPELRRSLTMWGGETRRSAAARPFSPDLLSPGLGEARHAATVRGATGLAARAMMEDAWRPRGLGPAGGADEEDEDEDDDEGVGEEERPGMGSGDEEEDEGGDELPDLRRAYTSAGFLRPSPSDASAGPGNARPAAGLARTSGSTSLQSSAEREDGARGQGKVRFYSFQRHIQQVAAAEASSPSRQGPLLVPSHRYSSTPQQAGRSASGMSRTALPDSRRVGQGSTGGKEGQRPYPSSRPLAGQGPRADGASSRQAQPAYGARSRQGQPGGALWSDEEEMRRWRRCAPGMLSEDEGVRSFQQSLARMSNGELPLPASFLLLPLSLPAPAPEPQVGESCISLTEEYRIPLAGSSNSLVGLGRRGSAARSGGTGSTEDEGPPGGLRRRLTELGGGEEESSGFRRRIRGMLGDEDWGGPRGPSNKVSWRSWRDRRGNSRASMEGSFDGVAAADSKSFAGALLGSKTVHQFPPGERDRPGAGGARGERRCPGSGSAAYGERDVALSRAPSEELGFATSTDLGPDPWERFKSSSCEDRLAEEGEGEGVEEEEAALAVMREGGMSSTLMRHGHQKLPRLPGKSRQECTPACTPPADMSRAHLGCISHPEGGQEAETRGMSRMRSFHKRSKREQGALLDMADFLPTSGNS